MIDSPRVAIAPAARWQRARRLVLVSMAGLPVLIGLGCLMLALLSGLDVSAIPWWSAIPVLAAFLSGIALMVLLRRDGLTDPASWFPATVLMTGAQLVFGVVPGFGVAMRSATGTAVVVKALLALGVLSAGSAWSLSRRAYRSLLASPVPEPGATPLMLVFRSRLSRIVIGTTADESVSVTVDADGVTTNVVLTEGIRGKSPQHISAEPMECVSRARTVVRVQVQDLMVERYAESVPVREPHVALAQKLAA